MHLWMLKHMSVQGQLFEVLIQMMYLMIPAPDILGIECWVLILFRFKSSPTEQYLINSNRNNI